MNVQYCQAKKEDAYSIAQLMRAASGGIVDFLLSDLLPGNSPVDLLVKAIADENSKFSYKNCLVALSDDQVVGEANIFPLSKKPNFLEKPPVRIPPIALLKLLWRGWSLWRMERQIPRGSLYINSLSVMPDLRGKGIGSELIGQIIHQARHSACTQVSLHLWADNYLAQKLYERHGFEVAAIYPLKIGKKMKHEGGQLLMVYSL